MAVKKLEKDIQRTVGMFAAQGKSTNKISKLTGLHHTSIKSILQQDDIINLKEEIEERLADKFEKLAEAILNSVSHDDLLQASLQQKSISAACMLDKSRLIRNRSTQNIAHLMASAVIAAQAEIDAGYVRPKRVELEAQAEEP